MECDENLHDIKIAVVMTSSRSEDVKVVYGMEDGGNFVSEDVLNS